ncbi:hypothetical protein ACLESO_05230 [Pyxidicoccus sp. 3LG]
MSWYDAAFRRQTQVTAKPLQNEVAAPPQNEVPANPPAQAPTGMPTKDEFQAGTAPKQGMPVLDPAAAAPPVDVVQQQAQQGAQQVADAYRTGGPSAATKRLEELAVGSASQAPAFVDALLRAAQPTLAQVGADMGVRVSKDKDDKSKDSFGKKDVTRDTLNSLAVVAQKAGPEGQQMLGKALADGLPDKNQLNQLDDRLKDMKETNPNGAALLGGAVITELQASGKEKAAKELRDDHRALDYGGRWKSGQPLTEAQNAHVTNTTFDFDAAVNEGKNWFEGDLQLNANGMLQMSHGEHDPKLSFKDWLAKGKELGVGMKVDVKFDTPKLEGPEKKAAIARMLDEVEASGIPSERLMFSVSSGEADLMRGPGRFRERFPNAIMGLNAPDKGGLSDDNVKIMTEEAKKDTGPVTFIVNYKDIKNGDEATLAAIDRLKKEGNATLSVWNAPSDIDNLIENPEDAVSETEKLKARGVDGMIDLRPSYSWAVAAGRSKQLYEDTKDVVGDAKDKVVSGFKSTVSFGRWD